MAVSQRRETYGAEPVHATGPDPGPEPVPPLAPLEGACRAGPLKKKKGGPSMTHPFMIGTAGFEPATPATPLQCATGLRHVPSGEV